MIFYYKYNDIPFWGLRQKENKRNWGQPLKGHRQEQKGSPYSRKGNFLAGTLFFLTLAI
jgi:hypothetical protein